MCEPQSVSKISQVITAEPIIPDNVKTLVYHQYLLQRSIPEATRYAHRTQKEWYSIYKSNGAQEEYSRKYLEKRKAIPKVQCECGGEYQTSNKLYHLKSKKHNEWRQA